MDQKGKKHLISSIDSIWSCPSCSYWSDKLVNLRDHVRRNHAIKITTIKNKNLSLEEKRNVKNNKKRIARKKIKSMKHRRDLFDMESIIFHGLVGCEESFLKYQQSTIVNAGNGIFTTIDFKTDDFITIYSGKLEDEKPEFHEYAVQLKNGTFIVGHKTPVKGYGYGSFINRSSSKKNCEMLEMEDYETIVIVATKNIKKGQELFTTYSKGYRLVGHNIANRTTLLKILPKLNPTGSSIDSRMFN